MIGTTIEFFDFYILPPPRCCLSPDYSSLGPIRPPRLSRRWQHSRLRSSHGRWARLFRPFWRSYWAQGDPGCPVTMGLFTVAIGALPTYRTIGVAAPLLLALFRLGQGLVSAASGEARCFWRSRMHRRTSAPGTACSRSSARRWILPSGGIFLVLSGGSPTSSLRLWLAHSVSGERRAGACRPLRAANDYRDAVFREALSRRERVKVRMLTVFREHTRIWWSAPCQPRHVRAFLPDDGVRAVLGNHGARLQPPEISGDAAVRHFLRDFHSARRGAGGTGTPPTLLWVTAAIGAFGLVLAPMFMAGTTGAVLMMVVGLVDGPDLRTARHSAFRAIPDLGAIHGKLADVQVRRHLRRFAGAVHRHVARQDLRAAIRRLLPLCGGGIDTDGLLAARETKDDDLAKSKV